MGRSSGGSDGSGAAEIPVAARSTAPSPAVAPPPGNPRFPLLDSIRGLAVLVVILFHTAEYDGSLGDPVSGDLLQTIGQQALVLFFAMSAFLLYRPFVLAHAAGRPVPSVGRFFRRRALRVLPAYWVALTVMAIYPGLTGVFTGDWWRYYFFAQIYSTRTVGGGIAPAWTLCVELTFYLAIPLFVVLARRLRFGREPWAWLRGELAVALATMGLGIGVQVATGARWVSNLVGTSFAGQSAWFGLGMALAAVSVALQRARREPGPVRVLGAHPNLCWLAAGLVWIPLTVLRHQPGGLLGIIAALNQPQPPGKTLATAALTAVMAGLIVAPALFGDGSRGAVRRLLSMGAIAWLGLVSYALYLWHLKIVELIAVGHSDDLRGGRGLGLANHLPFAKTAVLFVLALAVTSAIASLSYRYVELPFLRRKERSLAAPERARAAVAFLRTGRAAQATMAVLLVATGAFLVHLTRGTTFWFDEWIWALHRRGDDLATFLRPHNDHLSLVPVAIYKALFATAGLGDYRPYRALVILGHLACAALLFAYARRRVGDWLAVLPAVLLLFLGPAWQDILWPFQIAWLISVGAGVGALLALDRADRLGNVLACCLLILSIASSGVGVAIAVAVLVELVWTRRRAPRLWVVGIPIALYALWWANYHTSAWSDAAHRLGFHHPLVSGILRAPGYVADSAAMSVTSLAGIGYAGPGVARQPLTTWGAALATAAVLALAVAVRRRGIQPRLAALLAAPLAFWTLTAITRGALDLLPKVPTPAYAASRYLYVGGIFVLLAAVEAMRGVRVGRVAAAVAAVLVVAAAASNVDVLRVNAKGLRERALSTRAEVGALDIVRPALRRPIAVDPLIGIDSRSYFAARDREGSPAASPAELATFPEQDRQVADRGIRRVTLSVGPAPRPRAPGAAPVVERATGGKLRRDGGCVEFAADPRLPSGVPDLEIVAPPGGAWVTAAGGPATLAIRRFATGFDPLGVLRGPTAVRIAPDRAPTPWRLRLTPADRATVCGLR